MTQQNANRLDVISRPNFGGIGRSWTLVTPDDSPPASPSILGNVPLGTFALYSSEDGFIRFITRGQQPGVVGVLNSEVYWDDGLGNQHPVQSMLGPDAHNVFWLFGLIDSVRVYAPAGTYLYAEVIHVLSRETTSGIIHALSV